LKYLIFRLGVALSAAGSFFDNVGFTLQRLSHIEHPLLLHYWQTRKWKFGFVMFVLGNTLNALGLVFAPQSIFSSLGCLSIVFNVINARVFVGERVNRGIIFGTFLILAGSLLAVTFGPSSVTGHVFELEDFWNRMLASKLSLAVVLTWLSVTVFLYVSTKVLHRHTLALPVALPHGRPAVTKLMPLPEAEDFSPPPSPGELPIAIDSRSLLLNNPATLPEGLSNKSVFDVVVHSHFKFKSFGQIPHQSPNHPQTRLLFHLENHGFQLLVIPIWPLLCLCWQACSLQRLFHLPRFVLMIRMLLCLHNSN
jgi:hypothetical protein